jgi:hypothetical protein
MALSGSFFTAVLDRRFGRIRRFVVIAPRPAMEL